MSVQSELDTDTVPPPPPTTVATTVAVTLPDGCSPSSINEKKHVRRNSALKEWKEKAQQTAKQTAQQTAQQNKVRIR